MQQRTSSERYRGRNKMKRHQREMLFDVIFGFVCGVVVVTVMWLLLQWFHDSGAELLFRLFGAVGY